MDEAENARKSQAATAAQKNRQAAQEAKYKVEGAEKAVEIHYQDQENQTRIKLLECYFSYHFI